MLLRLLLFVMLLSSLISEALRAQAFETDQTNTALSFNGSSSFTARFSSAVQDTFTVGVWAYSILGAQSSRFIHFTSDTSSQPNEAGFGLLLHDGYTNPFVRGEGAGGAVSLEAGALTPSITANNGSLPTEEWIHFAFVRRDTKWELFKNGAIVGRGTCIPADGVNCMRIGSGFQGRLDEVRIWSAAMSSDEIRLEMFSHTPSSTNLVAWYQMDSSGSREIPNRALTSSAGSLTLDEGSTTAFSADGVQQQDSITPNITFSQWPQHYQFFGRDRDDFARVFIAGETSSETDTVYLSLSRRDEGQAKAIPFWDTTFTPGNSRSFEFDIGLRAELATYTLRCFSVKDGAKHFVAEAADLVAGDVYYIDGQSNAHPTFPAFRGQNIFQRSFGIQTPEENFLWYEDQDTLWGPADASGWGGTLSGPYMVGLWGYRLQEYIRKTFRMPTCIINGAAGASTIEQHLRPSYRYDPKTVYGRALYRMDKAKIRDKIRGIFWYQGEYDTLEGYYDNFKSLNRAWQQDLPATDGPSTSTKPRQVYVIQIHPGCYIADAKLRELQRTLKDSLPNITPFSTVALPGHNFCHFAETGYNQLAEQLGRLLGRDVYGSSDTKNVLPPNLRQARYTDQTRARVRLDFSNVTGTLRITNDTVVEGVTHTLRDYFFLDDLSGNVASIEIRTDTLFVNLRSPSDATRITYLPARNYIGTELAYEGPWLVGPTGLGALSFADVPIKPHTAPELDVLPVKGSSIRLSPNPAHDFITVSGLTGEFGTLEIFSPLGVRLQSTNWNQKDQVEIAIDPAWNAFELLFLRIANMSGSKTFKVSLH